MAIDEQCGGLACEEEGAHCAQLLDDPGKKVLVMDNHGAMIIVDSVADTFNWLYYFERAAETHIRALQTGRPLSVLSDEIAAKTSGELEQNSEQDARHLADLKAILAAEGSDCAA